MQQRVSPIEAADIDRRRVTGQLDASGREKVTASTQHGIAFGPHSGWHPHPLFPSRFSISIVVAFRVVSTRYFRDVSRSRKLLSHQK
jgi:hypothetical protein